VRPSVRLRSFALLALCAGAIPAARAQLPAVGPSERDVVVRDFRFASGESLATLTLHYRTLGRPRRDAAGTVRNAVLILHGTTGSGAQFLSRPFAGELFGPGQPLDTSMYFVVLPDGIGHGRSSRPSEGQHARFPRYSYDDMVDAQHRLLVDGLGVTHLRLVMGTSMGGMHSWVWGERYPTFMDGIVPLASVPTAIVGRNRMLRRMAMDDIRADPAWRNGDYAAPPPGLRAALQILWLMTSAPLVQHHDAPTRAAADSVITTWLDARVRTMDANDLLFAFDASRDYDPEPLLDHITAPVLAINSADDLVNPPELGLMERLMPRVKQGRYVLLPISPQTRGHGTHTIAAVWKTPFAAFLAILPRLPELR
jgi:homoserine O-acetyltransferase